MAKKDKGMSAFKERAKARASGPVRRLGPGETAEVRFVSEMSDEEGTEGWAFLHSHYDADERRTSYYRMGEAPAGSDVRDAFFCLAYSPDTGVEVWEIRKMLAVDLVDAEEDRGTICDRNYKLRRRGEGLETTYKAIAMDASPEPKKLTKLRASGALDSMLSDRLAILLDEA